MQKHLDISVYWLVNHIIHGYHKMIFIEPLQTEDDTIDHVICEWDDDYYKEHKQEVHKRIISFIVVTKNIIKVYLKKPEPQKRYTQNFQDYIDCGDVYGKNR